MAKWIVAGLIVLNLMLGAGVYLRLGEKTVNAQIGRTITQVATVAGQVGGNSVIYILDVNNGNLVALKNDTTNKRIDVLAQTNVTADIRRIGNR
ncbi:MAG: hypothetical protein FWD61_04035 [Phycisphaerales bacterium]|nr:hypothetical protein [Phycisphaerales bacterium]